MMIDVTKNVQIDFTEMLAHDSRNYFWNADFLDFLKDRASLSSITSVLDIGMGMGKWLSCIAPLVHPEAHLSGLDCNAALIEIAKKDFSPPQKTQTFNFEVGSVYELPYPDNAFELVTCQTLMLHLGAPQKALSEMMRVLKPGGMIILSEPNNYLNLVRSNTAQEALSIKERLELLELYSVIEKGKELLKEGQLNITVHIPLLLKKMGFEEGYSYKSDKSLALVPPYLSQEMKSIADFLQSLCEPDSFFLFNAYDTRRYYIAGGGTEERFKQLIGTSNKLNTLYLEKIEDQTLSGQFGADFLIHFAKKPIIQE